MPLISHGSFDTFRGVTSGPAETEYGVTGPQPFSVLREVTRVLQPLPARFERSRHPVWSRITGIALTAGSRSMLRRLLEPAADVHVLAWCWDLSGARPAVLPDGGAGAARWRLALSGAGRQLANGALPLWSGRPLVGGLAVRVILWQGEHPAVSAEVAEAVRHSRLASVLATIGSSSETTITSAVMAREAAAGLGPEVAPVLRALCPDYLDFFEGYFPAADSGGGGSPEGQDELSFAGYHGRLSVGWGG